MDFQPPARLVHNVPFVPSHLQPHVLHQGASHRYSSLNLNLLAAADDSYSSHTLAVPLDHGNPQDNRTHSIRYWVNSESWSGKVNAPIFLSVPGESAQPSPSPVPSWVTALGGLGISLEHRFFGSSVPTPDTSVASLKYLTIEQSLADMVRLLDHVKAERGLTGPVIAYGCSYPGALAAWLRTRYPTKVAAAIAASAPVQARVRFNDLDRSISLALQRHSPSCLAKVSATMDAIEQVAAESPAAKVQIKSLFKMPTDASLSQGDFDLRYMLADTVANAVQTGQKASLCSQLEGLDLASASPMALATHWSSAADIGSSFQTAYKSELLKDTSKTSGVKDNRLWTWLQCAQVGYLQPSNAIEPELPAVTARSKKLDLQAFLSNCEYLFPQAELRASNVAADFNSRYGGVKPDALGLTNILYLKYADDPWFALQPNSTSSTHLRIALSADGSCAHCGMGCSESFSTETSSAMHSFLGDALFKQNSFGMSSSSSDDSARLIARALQPRHP